MILDRFLAIASSTAFNCFNNSSRLDVAFLPPPAPAPLAEVPVPVLLSAATLAAVGPSPVGGDVAGRFFDSNAARSAN